jgi:hypothetical protein
MRRVTSTIPSSRYSGSGRRPRSPSNRRERKRPQNTSGTLVPEAMHSVLLPRRDSHALRNTPQRLGFLRLHGTVQRKTPHLQARCQLNRNHRRNVPQALASPVSSAAPLAPSLQWGGNVERRPSIRDLAWASQKEAKPGRGHAGGTVHTRPLVGIQKAPLGRSGLTRFRTIQLFSAGAGPGRQAPAV